MDKKLYIAEKPSVAREFAKILEISGKNADGYIESADSIVTWCVGHLVTMAYPDAYDPSLKKWSMDTIPFLPKEYKYKVIDDVSKQFKIVSGLLNRSDVKIIYVCTDSGREGEYIYRLVEMMSGMNTSQKDRRRVWINSQTKEEILRGVAEAKSLDSYDNLSAAAYLRAKEDYLMGINFSRVLSLKYGNVLKSFLKSEKGVISVGRVMTCVLGMVVSREREIRSFVKTPFYRVLANLSIGDDDGRKTFPGEWKAVEGSAYYDSPLLYKENGFKNIETAKELISALANEKTASLQKIERKTEKKNPPLLYNLAELQNDCSKLFKISPDQTLNYIQDMYEKKLLTYPRTDARVLSSAVAKEIDKNVRGLLNYPLTAPFAKWILEKKKYEGLEKTKYVNDKQITDHYAIIPTGQGLSALSTLDATGTKIYEIVVRRLLSIFCPNAEYEKVSLQVAIGKENFFSNFKVLKSEGYLKCAQYSFAAKKADNAKDKASEEEEETSCDEAFVSSLSSLKKGALLSVSGMEIKEGETAPPKRYNSGSMILAMENAGQLIEDEDLRAQIKGSGIGTSATRGEILKKLFTIKYLSNNKKTQIITPTLLGEMVYDIVDSSMKALLDPSLTASWEKGLSGVADGTISEKEYMEKLEGFVIRRTEGVKSSAFGQNLNARFRLAAQYYKGDKK